MRDKSAAADFWEKPKLEVMEDERLPACKGRALGFKAR